MKHAFTKRKLRSNELEHKLNKSEFNSMNQIYASFKPNMPTSCQL